MQRRAALTALCIIAAACFGGDSTEPTSTVTTVAPATTTTIATTTTAEPTTTTTTAAPQLVEEWKLSISTLGPIRVGMSVDEAKAAGAIELAGELDPAISENCYYVTPVDALDGVAFMVLDDEIVRIEIRAPSAVTTLSGARVGSTVEELRELWPDRLEDANESVSDGVAVAFVPSDAADADYRVVFELDVNSTVTAMRAGILPAVDFVEGCL
ncbi:MAG: hypothetical protein OEM97_04950 [Acidimicrobiia bacterium]|nr:hypothetical protein [Acidimicrobiia bacterium]